MKIKELADAADTTVRTVRYYHQEGLLPVPPAVPRDYTFAHVVRLTRIRHLVSSGLSLEQVRKLIEPGAVDVAGELRATKESIDSQIQALVLQKQRIEELEQRDESAPRTSVPLPVRIRNFYTRLRELAEDPGPIRREQHVVEVLAHLGVLSQFEYLWPENPSEEYVQVALQMFESFEHITELSPEEAETEIGALMDQHVATSGLDTEEIPDIVRRVLSTPHALKLVMLAYPHPNQQRYITEFFDRYS